MDSNLRYLFGENQFFGFWGFRGKELLTRPIEKIASIDASPAHPVPISRPLNREKCPQMGRFKRNQRNIL
jgi:hypothetical protein